MKKRGRKVNRSRAAWSQMVLRRERRIEELEAECRRLHTNEGQVVYHSSPEWKAATEERDSWRAMALQYGRDIDKLTTENEALRKHQLPRWYYVVEFQNKKYAEEFQWLVADDLERVRRSERMGVYDAKTEVEDE